MMNTIGEWIAAVALTLVLALLLMWGGVLVTGLFIAVIVAALIGSIFEGLSSLFSPTKEERTREEERSRDDET